MTATVSTINKFHPSSMHIPAPFITSSSTVAVKMQKSTTPTQTNHKHIRTKEFCNLQKWKYIEVCRGHKLHRHMQTKQLLTSSNNTRASFICCNL